MHAQLQSLVVIQDRERIARDLHDTIIQRLFATGLSLQATARLVGDDGPVADRIERAVDDLDVTIKQIRSGHLRAVDDDSPGWRRPGPDVTRSAAGRAERRVELGHRARGRDTVPAHLPWAYRTPPRARRADGQS